MQPENRPTEAERPAGQPPRRRSRGIWVVLVLFLIGAIALTLLVRRGGDEGTPSGGRLGGPGTTPSEEVSRAVTRQGLDGAPDVCTSIGAEIERQLARVPARSVSDVEPEDVQRTIARAVALSGNRDLAVLAVPLSAERDGRQVVEDFRDDTEQHNADTPIHEISRTTAGGGSDAAATPLRDVTGCGTVTIRFGSRSSLTYAIGVTGQRGPDFCSSFEISHICDRG